MPESDMASDRFSVSVVIPAYNAASTILETLASVTSQIHAPSEIIVVDDGSTDGTADLVREFQTRVSYLKVLTQANAGVAAARNYGIAVAKGNLIAPLDADDLWHPTYLDRIVDRFRSEDPSPVLVYAHCRLIDARSRVIGAGLGVAIDGPAVHRMRYCNLIGNGSGMVVRRDALLAAGGYESRLRAGGCEGYEDYLLQLRLSAIGPIAAVNAFLVGYRQRSDAMSANVERMARSEALARTLAAAWTGPVSETPSLARWQEGTRLLIQAQAYAGSSPWTAARFVGRALLVDPVATFWAIAGRLRSIMRARTAIQSTPFLDMAVEEGASRNTPLTRPGLFTRLQRRRLARIAHFDRTASWLCPPQGPASRGLRVSVVLPVHNGERYVEQAIRSILCQSFSDFELIVGDDGSTDGTADILARLQREHPSIRLLRRPTASGLADAANWVVSHARENLIAIAHADDFAYPRRLERQVGVLQSYEDAVLVGSPPIGIDPAGRQVHPPNLWRIFHPTASAPFAHSSILFRREAFDAAGGYRSAANYWEDLDLFNRISAIGKILVIPEALTSYRYGPQSTRERDQSWRVENAIHYQYVGFAEGRDEHQMRLYPRVFVARAWVNVWLGQRSFVIFRLLRRGRIGINWHSFEALIFTTLALAVPRVLRGTLSGITHIRNFMVGHNNVLPEAIVWKPSVGKSVDRSFL